MNPFLRTQIIIMAKIYAYKKDCTYDYLAEKFGISKSTVFRYFHNYLPEISAKLYVRVKDKIKENIDRSRQNFAKNVS